MKKFFKRLAVVAAMVLMTAEASAQVTYQKFTIQKYGVTCDIPKGMRRTDNPVMDNGANFTMVPKNADDFPIYAAVQVGVYETYFGDYTDEKIKRSFDNDIPEEAEKKLDLEKKEYTYSVPGEYVSEYHRVIFRGNQQISVLVSYSKKWEPKLGGAVRDHILNSLKFN